VQNTMLIVLLALVSRGATQSVQVGQDAVLASSAELFGPRVEVSPALFEINRFYVLRVEFGADGRLARAAIQPKYYYAETHPNWEEPDDFEWLSPGRVAELLTKIDRLQPIGKLVKPHSGIAITTNLTTPLTDEYEHAMVRRGEILRLHDREPVLVRYLTVQYERLP
jgi:hypothetical protein